MASNAKWLVAVGLGFTGGWVLRSISDSRQDAGVKLLEIAMRTKERVSQWVAVEAEQFEDKLAEARANSPPDIAPGKAGRKSAGRRARTGA